MNARAISRSTLLFILAGLLEIGGGYLVWLWLRQEMSFLLGAAGGFVLFLYAIVPTFQKAHFGRVYAAYGGIFIVMAMLWGWAFDGRAPDSFDLVGGATALVGVSLIMYWPRGKTRR